MERAYRPSARQQLLPSGSALIVLGPNWEAFDASRPLRWRRTVVVGARRKHLASQSRQRGSACFFACRTRERDLSTISLRIGELDASELAMLPPASSAEGGLLAAGTSQCRRPGARGRRAHPLLMRSPSLERHRPTFWRPYHSNVQRFDVRPGGTVLVHWCRRGGWDDIHVHRLLQLEDGPSTVIATSRSLGRQTDLEEGFRRGWQRHRPSGWWWSRRPRRPAAIAREAPGWPGRRGWWWCRTPQPWRMPQGGWRRAASWPSSQASPMATRSPWIWRAWRFRASDSPARPAASVDDMKDVLARVERGRTGPSCKSEGHQRAEATPQGAGGRRSRGGVRQDRDLSPSARHAIFAGWLPPGAAARRTGCWGIGPASRRRENKGRTPCKIM